MARQRISKAAIGRIIPASLCLALTLVFAGSLPAAPVFAQPTGETAPQSAEKSAAVDGAILKRALDAARRDWSEARRLAAPAGPVASLVVEWRYLLDEAGAADFPALAKFLDEHPNWPRHDALLARAENALPAEFSPADVIAWFKSRAPVSGNGMLRLGDALMQTGQAEPAAALIRKAWIESSFTAAEENKIVKSFASVLGPVEQKMRLHHLLNDNVNGGAITRQMARVDAATHRVVSARLKIKASPATAKAVLTSLPEAERENPELLLDAARALRRRGLDEEALELMERAPAAKDALQQGFRWAVERQVMARGALGDGKYDIAYRLAAAAAESADTPIALAESEFLAGWIALRFQNDPEHARGHFERLAKNVTLPITVARAYYWLGRTAEALKQPAEATTAFRVASGYPATFYGQLALSKLSENPILHVPPPEAAPTEAERAGFEADERVQALRLLSSFSDRYTLRLFAIRIGNDPPDAARMRLLAQLMESLGDRAMSLRVAKTAAYDNLYLVDQLHPVIPLPSLKGISPDPALVLALTRQESEFDPAVVSSAGARGLMQLMPASAKHAAGKTGLPYRLKDLTTDPVYNMRLGMTTIDEYLERWDGSYVLAIASYNAGPNNVRKWVENFGDPRIRGVDPVDWIESIPFPETRNYVMRVLENVEVYRNRLGGSNRRLEILPDLYRPGPVNIEAWNAMGTPVPTTTAVLSGQ